MTYTKLRNNPKRAERRPKTSPNHSKQAKTTQNYLNNPKRPKRSPKLTPKRSKTSQNDPKEALREKPYFPRSGISWKDKKDQVNIIFPSTFWLKKIPYFPSPKSSKQECFSNQ